MWRELHLSRTGKRFGQVFTPPCLKVSDAVAIHKITKSREVIL
jgi:hypothetical protein